MNFMCIPRFHSRNILYYKKIKTKNKILFSVIAPESGNEGPAFERSADVEDRVPLLRFVSSCSNRESSLPLPSEDVRRRLLLQEK